MKKLLIRTITPKNSLEKLPKNAKVIELKGMSGMKRILIEEVK